MKAKFKVNGRHEGEAMTVDIEVEFEKGEYLEILKTMPNIITQVRALVNEEKSVRKAKKAMRKNAKRMKIDVQAAKAEQSFKKEGDKNVTKNS